MKLTCVLFLVNPFWALAVERHLERKSVNGFFFHHDLKKTKRQPDGLVEIFTRHCSDHHVPTDKSNFHSA